MQVSINRNFRSPFDRTLCTEFRQGQILGKPVFNVKVNYDLGSNNMSENSGLFRKLMMGRCHTRFQQIVRTFYGVHLKVHLW
jgi:hypothetical protein